MPNLSRLTVVVVSGLVLGAPGEAGVDCDGPGPEACFFFHNSVPGALVGTSVTDVGDTNGDGFPDVVVGAPGEGQGRIYIFLGHPTRAFGTPVWSVDGSQA